MNTRLVSAAIMMLALILLLVGCGQPAAPAPAPTAAAPIPTAAAPVPTAAPAPAPPAVAPTVPAAAQPTAVQATGPAYPERGKPITIIVPWAAGGGNDLMARMLAPMLERELGTPVQITNKGGAGSQIGLTDIANSRPDGYTIGVIVLPPAINIYLDPDRQATFSRQDFIPIAVATTDVTVTAVRADSPYQTMKDLVDAARANPEKITVSDSGIGSTSNLTTLALEKAAGVKFATVHMEGDSQQLPALLGGHVDANQLSVAGVLAQYRSNDVRVLATSAESQSKFFPDAQPLVEQGYNVVLPISRGFGVPAGTPQEIVDVLSTAFQNAINSDEFETRAEEIGAEPNYLGPADYDKQWADMEVQLKPLLDDIKATQKSK